MKTLLAMFLWTAAGLLGGLAVAFLVLLATLKLGLIDYHDEGGLTMFIVFAIYACVFLGPFAGFIVGATRARRRSDGDFEARRARFRETRRRQSQPKRKD